MPITHIDRNVARDVQARIQNLLKDLEEETGLEVKIDKMRFSSGSVSMNVNAGLGVDIGETAMGRQFKMLASRYGLAPEDLGKNFMINGTLFKITGLKTTRPKFPVEGERVCDGQPYKFTPHQVRMALGR